MLLLGLPSSPVSGPGAVHSGDGSGCGPSLGRPYRSIVRAPMFDSFYHCLRTVIPKIVLECSSLFRSNEKLRSNGDERERERESVLDFWVSLSLSLTLTVFTHINTHTLSHCCVFVLVFWVWVWFLCFSLYFLFLSLTLFQFSFFFFFSKPFFLIFL